MNSTVKVDEKTLPEQHAPAMAAPSDVTLTSEVATEQPFPVPPLPVPDQKAVDASRTWTETDRELAQQDEDVSYLGDRETRSVSTHTHNRFTALLEFVWDHLGEQVPER